MLEAAQCLLPSASAAPRAARPAATREDWLHQAVQHLRPAFLRVGTPLPDALHVSIGFPSTRALSRRVGECWAPEASRDGRPHLFVSPLLGSSLLVLGTLVHELVHAAVGVGFRHGPPFRRAALALGLVGRMTATVPGPELTARLDELASVLGPFPHAGLDAAASGHPKQSTRLLKLTCPACGYTIRTTARWVAVGLPTCPCGDSLRLNASAR